ncbi:MAG: thioredoxin family protein [Pirellulales bacterium]|nr:thioredoxin family protein [Pirellulales bacterium]
MVAAVLVGTLSASAPGQIDVGDPSGGLSDLFGGGSAPPIAISAQFTQPTPQRPAELVVTADMPPGWHVYSITQPPGGPVATTIRLDPSPDYRQAGPFTATPPPEKKVEPLFDNITVESHYGRVTWRAPLELRPGVDPAGLAVRGVVNLQPCDPTSCLPPRDFPFTARLGQDTAPANVSPAAAPRISVVPTVPAEPAVVAPPPTPTIQTPQVPETPPPAQPAAIDAEALKAAATEELKMSLEEAMGWGFLGGLILNLMPCVFPVIGLKILSFVEQAGQSRRKALVLNVWYAVGLIAVFLVLASFPALASEDQRMGWGQQFQYSTFNITLAAVVFVMALSFLGVWEIPIPGFVGSGRVEEWSRREGAVGAITKGAVTTVLATPCGAPLLGPALAWSVAQPPAIIYAVFASAGLGMASPYLVLGAFPELLRFLPKPGAWMETFKQIMGFILLATVVYLLTILSWAVVVPTIALLFGLWFACWWIGRIPLTAGSAARTRGWIGAAVIGFLAWVVAFPGIDEVATGRFAFGGLHDIMRSRYAFDMEKATGTIVAMPDESEWSGDEYHWRPFTRAALNQLVTGGYTVLVDFTADWCLTCKTFEAQVLDTPPVHEVVRKNRVVMVKADWGKDGDDPEVTAMLELLGSKQVPVIAVFPAGNPNNPTVFRGGYTQTGLIAALEAAGPSESAARAKPAAR